MKKKWAILGAVLILLAAGSVLLIYKMAAGGADPAMQQELAAAIAAGDSGRVKELIRENGTLLDAQLEDGGSPLEYAAANQNYPLVSWLLDQKPEMPDGSAMPFAIQLAFSLNDSSHIKNEKEKEAVRSVFVKIAALDRKELKKTNDRGNTVLHIAALKGEAELVRLLLEEGLDPKAVNEAGETPAAVAVQAGKPDAAAVLLEAAPELGRMQDKNGNTLLHTAAAYGTAEQFSSLTDLAGLNLDARNGEGKTALMYVSEFGGKAAVKRLLKAGADPLAESAEGRTAYEYAKLGQRPEIAAILKKAAE